jgi:hypothetical protein
MPCEKPQKVGIPLAISPSQETQETRKIKENNGEGGYLIMKLNWANSIKTYLKVLPFVLLTIFFIGPFITSSYAALLFEGDFETGDLGDFHTGGCGIPPTPTSSLSRTGTYAMESLIEPGEIRSEVAGPWANVGEEYWYGFSIFLPEDFIVNDLSYEILAQWHGYPDFDIGETWRNPVMGLYSSGEAGEWSLVIRYDSKRNTFESGERVYDGEEEFHLGSWETGVWTDWVFHVRWSYESDGLLEIWKNGVKVLYYEGPNAFNDAEGPYFKMGIYSGDVPCTRIVYHDEFRMADANSTYEDVAPGEGATEPSVPGLATLLTPSGIINETAPAFTWNAVEGATMYLLYVEGPSSAVIEQWYDADTITTGDTCSVTPDLYLQDGDYFWEIQTRNDVGYGNWSTALQFSVAAAEPSVPGTATLLSPSSITKDKTPTYTCISGLGATMYLLYVEGPSGAVIEQWYDADTITTGDTCSVEPDVTLARGKYSWGIRASNDNGYGDWSNALLFKVVGKK